MASGWTFLSNHGHVLVCLAVDPDARMRDVAEVVGITERAVQHIVRDLVDEGYVVKTKDGRRNRYQTVAGAHFRHHLEAPSPWASSSPWSSTRAMNAVTGPPDPDPAAPHRDGWHAG